MSAAAESPFGRISLGQAAEEIILFEQARAFTSRGEITIAPSLRDVTADIYGPLQSTATVRNYKLRDVVLDADTLYLLKGGALIEDTGYFVPGSRFPAEHVDPQHCIAVSADEDVVIGCNNVHEGYQHWVSQCLPAIDAALRQKRTRPVRLLLPELQQWQEDFLRILGHAEVPRLAPQPGHRYLLAYAEYADYLNGSHSFAISLEVMAMARRILRALPAMPSPHDVLYVPCTNPYYGTIRNEEVVRDVLTRRGIHVVEPGLPTAERINLFRHAQVVIGPLGQGLTDILFCRPGTLVWEWMPRHHQNASFNRLAQSAELDYWGDVFPNAAEPDAPYLWDIDLDALADGLSRISVRLALAATQPRPVSETDEEDAAKAPDRPLTAMEKLARAAVGLPPDRPAADVARRSWFRRMRRRG